MIYEATPGQDILMVQAAAIEANCDRILFNGKIYRIKIELIETGETIVRQLEKDKET